MPRRQLNRLPRLHARRHEPLRLGANAAILLGDLIPRRLHLPRHLGHTVTKRRRNRRLLRHRHNKPLLPRRILTKRLMELLRPDPEEPIAVRDEAALRRRHGGVPLRDAGQALALVGREGGDVDEADDVGQFAAHLGDDGPAVGVPDEEHVAVDLRDHLARARGVVGEGGEGQLDGVLAGVAAAVEVEDDAGPVGGVAPEAVDEDDGGFAHFVDRSPSGWPNVVVMVCGTESIDSIDSKGVILLTFALPVKEQRALCTSPAGGITVRGPSSSPSCEMPQT